ncbi:MAG: hypothetical protein ACFFDQ_05815, partial [Candidatus Thorarchaeota archaeon]
MHTYFRYPTKQQGKIWLKRKQNISPSDIAKQMNVSRPYVSKAQRIAEQRISKLLKNAATINRISIEHSSSKFGFAVGYCPGYKSISYVTYSPQFGVQIWFDHEGDCGICPENSNCERIIRGLAEEWKTEFPSDFSISQAASFLFNTIMR